ncbi:MAG: acyltransferase family protein [Limisphaerales bacterium]|nr:MAG: acyltransferase family protein [Limisphaerales bacterium]KAG0510135.1 MAG: acyltransferase family protein [Limisphaerales bacterium]TXT52978.1 MAG: acyltransferase family protein [Limisphaerales bacterium]
MRLDKLDLVRGVAALAVLFGHLRAFLFVEHSAVAQRNVVTDAFYGLTGFGHQAVVIFFVLSGFLIGGAVQERFATNRWSFGDYALRRMTRLWLVLLPALALTLGWDLAGGALSGGAGYDGRYYERIHSGPSAAEPADSGVPALLGNVFFLQTIVVRTFGSNGPLWSLANEFWYYLMFPLGFAACHPTTPARLRMLCLVLLAAAGAFLPVGFLLGGSLWLAGYAASVVARSRFAPLARSAPVFWGALLALGGVLLWNRWRGLEGADYWIALAFAATLPRLAADTGGSDWWRGPARYFGNTSYTLYLFHFPFLAFLSFGVLQGRQWQPGAAGFAVYAGIVALTLAGSHLVWWLFERRTEEVRRAVNGWLTARRQPA